jgi:hypothetical protein
MNHEPGPLRQRQDSPGRDSRLSLTGGAASGSSTDGATRPRRKLQRCHSPTSEGNHSVAPGGAAKECRGQS